MSITGVQIVRSFFGSARTTEGNLIKPDSSEKSKSFFAKIGHPFIDSRPTGTEVRAPAVHLWITLSTAVHNSLPVRSPQGGPEGFGSGPQRTGYPSENGTLSLRAPLHDRPVQYG